MKNHCHNFIQQYQNITLLKQEFSCVLQKAKETNDPTKAKEVKKELKRRVKELQENVETYLDETLEYLYKDMTRRSKRVIIQLQKALNEGAEEMGKEPEVIGEDSFGGYSGQIQIDNAGEIKALHLQNTKITSLDKVKLPDSLRSLNLSNTKITSLDKVTLPDDLSWLYLNNTKITSLDKVTLPDGLEWLNLADTPLAEDEVKLQALKDKYPEIFIITY